MRRAALLGALAVLALPGAAARADSKPTQHRKVALTPLDAIGSEAGDRERKQVEGVLLHGFESIASLGFSFVKPAEVRQGLRKGKTDLNLCDGDISCLARMGATLGVDGVVYGELGGLGEARVVYLKLIGVKSGREVRSTTVELEGKEGQAEVVRAAATRLLAPERYTGELALQVDARGASVFVDGDMVGQSPLKSLRLAVGTHAVRITHPEFRDFVRFVDVGFGGKQKLDVELHKFPVIDTDLRHKGRLGLVPTREEPVEASGTPWYGRWYTIAGAGALLLITSAVVVGLATDGIDSDREKALR